MPSGLPDWSKVKTALDRNYSYDQAELAVRLGSPVRLYRSGDVISYSSFESGDDYIELFASGTNAICEQSSDKALFGANSLKMSLDSTDTAASAVKRLPFLDTSICALSWAMDIRSLTSGFLVHINVHDGSLNKWARLFFDVPNDEISILTPTSTAEVIRDYFNGSANGNHEWLSCKLWSDVPNNKYFALDLNGTLFDLSQYDLRNAASAVRPNVSFTFSLVPPSSDTSILHIDDVVFTINDPS